MTKKITILHLSDLHISEKTFKDQKIVLAAFFKDLKRFLDEGKVFDLVFFTGDLVGKGDFSQNNINLVQNEFFNPLLEVLALKNDNLFISPGNHDIELSKFNSALRPSFDALTDTKKTNEFLDRMESSPYFFEGLKSFNTLAAECSNSNPIFKNLISKSYKININDLNIGICCFNSAWLATGGANDIDYGRLQVGQRQVDLLLESITDCNLKFALLHHPLSWLTTFDQRLVRAPLLANFDAIFYGHNHEADSHNIVQHHYSTLISNSGCLYQSRDYFNGYSILSGDFHANRWNVSVREYYHARDVFDMSVRFAKNGEDSFDLSSEENNSIIFHIPSIEYTTAVNENIDNRLLTSSISNLAPKRIESIFVPPPLSLRSERQLNDDVNREELKYLDLKHLLKDGKPVFFIGQKEYGKTTLLHHICADSLNNGNHGVPRYGIYVNLATSKQTIAGIIESIISFSNGEYKKAEILRVLENGLATICFDNLPFDDSKYLKLLEEFVKKYPKNQFYFSLNESFQSSISTDRVPMLGLEANIVYIHSFGRRQTRNLVSKWFGEADGKLKERVESILNSFSRLNIPRTPFLISLLLWVQEKNISFSPVNQAEILDTFIDGVLDKLGEEKKRSNIDSTVKRHFLSALAYEMYSKKSEMLTQNELEQFGAQYFKSKGLVSSSSALLLDELKLKGLLIDLGGEVAFKYGCLKAFFLSSWFPESNMLLAHTNTPESFISLGEELDYFTGKNRNRPEVLINALDQLDKLYDGLNLDLGLELFDTISIEESPLIKLKNRDEIGQILLGERISEEAHQELLDDMDLPLPSNATAKVNRKSHGTNFINALQIASTILRNSELIDDVELKNKAYTKIIQHWGQLLIAILLSFEYGFDKMEEVPVAELTPEVPNNVAKYIIKLMIPNALFGIVLEKLGTSKLELMIRDNMGNSDHNVIKLLSTVLYSDLEFPDRLKKLELLTQNPNAGRLLVEIVFSRLILLFYVRKLTSKEEAEIVPIISEMFVKLSGTKDPLTFNAFKSKVSDNLTKKKHVDRFNDVFRNH